jgi:hypothetical protein
MSRFLFLTTLVAVVVAMFAPRAQASGVVFEAYSGKRPDNATELLTPAMEELRGRGFLVGPEVVGGALEEKESRPGGGLDDKEVARLSQLVSDGYDAWYAGEFDNEAKMLGSVVETLRANPAAIARAQELRKLLEQALIGFAIAQVRLGHADVAESTMGEFLRSFPDIEVSRATYGPEALALYQRVKKQMDAGGRGTLFVDCDDPNALLFINERYESVGKITKKGLWPGSYRIFVQRGGADGRLHTVKIEPGRKTVLKIDWSFDTALVSSADWAGLLFTSPGEMRSHVGPHAVRAATVLGASPVVVLGIAEVAGRPAVIGSAWDVQTGKPTRTAFVAVEPGAPGRQLLGALARFLAGEKAEEGVLVQPPGSLPGADVERAPELTPGSRFGAWKWVASGGAVASITLGAWLISIDGKGTDCPPGPPGRCPYTWTTLDGGIALVAAGAALGGVATWMFFRDRPKSHTTVVGVAPWGNGASLWVGGEF